MAFMVNAPQAPDIWSGYYRSLEGIGQGIGGGVTAYLAEKRKKEETEKARKRLKELLTERKQVEGTVLANPPLDTSEGMRPTNLPPPELRTQYPNPNLRRTLTLDRQQTPDMTPTIGQKIIETVPDIPMGLSKEDYDAMTVGTMSRRLLEPWEEKERQRKLTDVRSDLDYRSKLARAEAEHKAGLEPPKPKYEERDTYIKKTGKWQKEASTDAGVTWQKVGGEYDKDKKADTLSPTQKSTQDNQWGDDFFTTLKSIAAKDDLGNISDPAYESAIELSGKYKKLYPDPRTAAVRAYKDAGRLRAIQEGRDYYMQAQNKDAAVEEFKKAGWSEADINKVTGGDNQVTLPPNITTTSQAKSYLMEQHGMSEQQAVDWIRSNQ